MILPAAPTAPTKLPLGLHIHGCHVFVILCSLMDDKVQILI